MYVLYFGLWVTMFFFAKKFLKEDMSSILCATIFSTSHYMFYEIFGRAAIGEAVAIIFYLILLLGIYNMLHENYTKPWLFIIAFAGILFSHMTTLFFAGITLVLVVLFNCKKLFIDKKFWIKSSLVLMLFLIVGLYSIASFIEMYFADTYQISDPWIIPSNCSQYLINILGFTSANAIGPILPVLAIVLRIVISKCEDEDMKLINKFLIISLVLTVITSKLFPWKLFDGILGGIQFPWRLNFIITILLSIVVTFEIRILAKNKIETVKILVVFLAFVVLLYNNLRFMKFYDGRELLDYSNRGVFEWYPVVTEIEDFEDRNIYDNSQNVVAYERTEHTTDLNFDADGNDDYYIVPIVCYKGYEATLVDENGKTSNLVIKRCDNGMIKIFTNKQKGKVYLHYAGTTIQNVTFWISFMGTLVLIVGGATYAIVKKKREHN